MVLSMHATDIMPMRQGRQTVQAPIGRELINRIPNNDARKALFLTEDKFPGYNFNDGFSHGFRLRHSWNGR